MSIPEYHTIMLPFLQRLSDGEEHSLREMREDLAVHFNLSEEELNEKLSSGLQGIFENRVGWARTYLKKARLLDSPKRGVFRISSRGQEVLKEKLAAITPDYLDRFEEFREFRTASKASTEKPAPAKHQDSTPEESLETAYQTLRDGLMNELLQQIKDSSPSLFERLVVELIVKMGYGGSLKDAGKAIGKSSDEGIDGIIKEDKLGLDTIYIQAKKWENTVGRPDIQKFAGALQGQRAKKGIFITTSGFSKEAYDYVSKIDSKIILINGPELAEYMIDHNLAVTPIANYEVKRLDMDYFTDE